MSPQATIRRTRQELEKVLSSYTPALPLLYEALNAARHPELLRARPATPLALGQCAPYLESMENIPLTTYTLYRDFARTGERRTYQQPLFAKRAKLEAAVLQLLLGEERYLDTVQDYIWNICEETNWVMPAHERLEVDLGAVGAAVLLAETITLLGDRLTPEIVERARAEIERRILEPYRLRRQDWWWFQGTNNWNGVCNSGVGLCYLILEKDIPRLAEALEQVLAGLETFLNTAFEADGGSTEGVGYWAYGLSLFIPFAELLCQRTGGLIDLLACERMRQVAAYPSRVMLSPGRYAAFSDCHEEVHFAPGVINRLAERTTMPELLDVLAEPAQLDIGADWRNLLWWNGQRPTAAAVRDLWLQDVDAARLVARTPEGAAVVCFAKAGHNAENHNQNDVGSFILHIGGETFLTDPGAGLYSRAYFSPQRYENIFANSFGHSVPRIGNQLQASGRQFAGQITAYDAAGPDKRLTMAIAGAYAVPELQQLTRSFTLTERGEFILEDTFAFPQASLSVEEAFVTWLESKVAGETAQITGGRFRLTLSIESPAGATFALATLTDESAANAKPTALKRLTIALPPATQSTVRVRGRVTPR